MLQFQKVSNNESSNLTESSGQIICLVSVAFMIGDVPIIQYTMIANHATQQTRRQVVGVLCTQEIIHWNARFQSARFTRTADRALSYPKSVTDYLNYKLIEAELAKKEL